MRRPRVQRPIGLGVGLNLPWGADIGFSFDPVRGDCVSDRVVRFLTREKGTFSYLFASFQPKDRNRLDARDYFAAYDDLFGSTAFIEARGLHQTAFNLGALEPYCRRDLVELTNELVERYGLLWINEDLGLWSIHGHPLPYPLPPYLTDAGLRAAIANTEFVQSRLAAPLAIEFPGFSEGTSLCIGRLHAYDFFRQVVEETGSPATLDTGHLLSYQWLRGRRGDALYEELHRLPTESCIEIHLSGCEITAGRFCDYHHGVLMHEQLVLLERLLPLCPNLLAVTYEDPVFDAGGVMPDIARDGFRRLEALVSRWISC